MSFRLKTIFGIALIEAVLLSVLLNLGLGLVKQMGGDRIARDAGAMAQLFSAVVQDAVLTADLATMQSMVTQVAQTDDVVYARVIAPDGTVLAESGQALASGDFKFSADTDIQTVNDAIFDVSKPIATAGRNFGSVQLGLSTLRLEESLRDARSKGAMLSLFFVLLTGLFSYLLGSYLTQQLNGLTRATHAIMDGRTGHQITVVGKDELASTARAFNQMSIRVQRSINELSAALQQQTHLGKQLREREAALLSQQQLLDAIAVMQSLYIGEVDGQSLFNRLVAKMLQATGCEIAFLADLDPSLEPGVNRRLLALANVNWDVPDTSQLSQWDSLDSSDDGYSLEGLIGQTLVTGEGLILGEHTGEVGRGPLIPGHPEVHNFMGMPLFVGPELVGMAGLTNLKRGCNAAEAERLKPLFNTLGQIMLAHRKDIERRQDLISLVESQARLTAVLDSAVDGIVTIDMHGRVDSINPAAQRMFGYRADEILGKNVKCLMPQSVADHHDDYLAHYQAGGSTRIMGIDRELIGQRKDGSVFPIELSVAEMPIAGEMHFNGIIRDISERKEREQLLQKTSALQNAILQGSNYAIVAMGLDGVVQTFNAAAERMSGLAADQACGQHFDALGLSALEMKSRSDELSQALGVGVAPGFEALVAMARRFGSDDREWTLALDNGSRLPVSASVSCLRDVTGAISGFLAIAVDISERRADERRMRENDLRRAAIAQGALDCIVVMDHQGLVQEFNPAAEAVFGVTKAAMMGQSLVNVMIPDRYREAHKKGMARFLATGEAVVVGKRIEISALRADGSEFPIELSISSVTINQQPVFTAYIRDISQTKLTQDKLRRFSTELNAVFNLSPDGFVTVSGDGICSYSNPAFTKMTGLAPEYVQGLNLNGFCAAFRSLCDIDCGYQPLEGAHDGATDVVTLTRPHHRIVQRSVRTFEDGQALGRIYYFRDVTHETEVDRMKSEFLSTAAHELRTPMASIHGFSELLLTRKFDEATQKDLLATIYRQSSNLVHLVTELLDLARIEARSGKDFNIKVQPLQPIIESTVAGFKAPEGHYTFSMDLPERPMPVAVDTEKMGQVLLNLISNAYKYSPDGGAIQLSIHHRHTGDREEIGIRVRDEGLGLTPEQQERVFERFYRADASGAIPGTGLGLSLVKEIVELHQGQMQVSSTLGKGTEMTCWLPAVTEGNDTHPSLGGGKPVLL